MVDFRGTFNARNRVAFEQKTENHFCFLDWQVHPVQRLVTCIREYLAALGALVSLAVLALTELPAFCTAVVAGHCEISY